MHSNRWLTCSTVTLAADGSPTSAGRPDSPPILGRDWASPVQSSAFTPGLYSLAHHYSGVEAVSVLEGEACFETPTRAVKLQKGETLAIPADVPMRRVVTGSTLRRLLAIIVHDAALPATMRMQEGGATARRVQVKLLAAECQVAHVEE